MYKNYNISRHYTLDSSLSRVTPNSSGYVDISASDPRIFNQCSKKITGTNNNFGIPRSTSKFSEYDAEVSKRKGGKDKTPIQRDSGEAIQGAKEIDRSVIIYSSSSSSSPSSIQGGFAASTNSSDDLEIFYGREVEYTKTGKGKATLNDTKPQSVRWEVFNFSPTPEQLITSDVSTLGWGHHARGRRQEDHVLWKKGSPT